MTAAGPTRRRWPAVLAWAVASAPIAISAVVAIARREWQAGDRSIMGVFTHDVFSAHPPLLGTISTLGNYAETGQGHPVHHLGPAQFYALALPDWMVGGHPAGLIVGGMLVNVAAVALVIVATRRRTGDAGMAAMAAVSVGLAYGLGPALLRDIWTPYLGLWPLLALLALTWSLIDGDLWALPWAAVVASFLAQIELLFVGPVLVLVAAGTSAVGVRAWRRRGDPDGPGLRRPIVLAAAWSLVIWLPVLIQEVSGNPGNLTLLVQSLGGQGDRAGWGFVGRNLVAQVQLPPIWLVRARTPLDVGDDVSVLDAIGAIVVVASLALLTVRAVARRRTEPTAAALLATVWAALLGGAFNLAITPAEGLIGLQYRRWMWPVGAFLWFALAYATWVEA
ncbi:MAG: hypothetical protein KDA98_17715, partial [Acidimicrobiales bacterium]|nr:hypothetical protein [Acidimicrobiales bacterium]